MLIIKYPTKIELPIITGGSGNRILYARFTGFNLEDKQSGVNWYFTYKRELKKLVIFKEHVNGVIKKYEIPTARSLKYGIKSFVQELEKIGIEVENGI